MGDITSRAVRRVGAGMAVAAAMSAALPLVATGACPPATVALPHPPGFEFGEVLAFGPRGLIGGTAAHLDEATDEYSQVAVLWRGGRPFVVGDLPDAFVADINRRGDVLVTGGWWPAGRAILISGGVARELPGLLGDGEGHVYARRLNDRGDVAGAAMGGDGREKPVIWRRGRRPVVLPIPEGDDGLPEDLEGFAQGINERGDAVGGLFKPWEFAAGWIWRADGSHERLDSGDWGPDDPGYGLGHVVDDAGRVAGGSGPFLEAGSLATIWTDASREVAGIEDGWATFYGTNDQGDFVGGAVEGPGFFDGLFRTLLMRAGGPPLTLLPLSRDPRDEGLAHAVSRTDRGDVTVGGFSTPEGGGAPQATLWRCAYRQARPYDALDAPPGATPRHGRRQADSLAARGRKGAEAWHR